MLPPPATAAPRAAVLLLHGLDMSPAMLAPLARALKLPAYVALPAGPVERPDGQRGWWPVDDARRAARLAAGPTDYVAADPPGRAVARVIVRRAAAVLRARAGPELPLVVAGFSQGGMLALDALLMDDPPLEAGEADVESPATAYRPQMLALWSSSRIAFDAWRPSLSRVAGLDVQVVHGRQDANLGLHAGEALRDSLGEAGARVEWTAFEGGHEIPLTAWAGLRRWVRAV